MKHIHLCYINIVTFWVLFPFLSVFMLRKELIKVTVTVMVLLALICTRFLNLFSHNNVFNCCFNNKEEFCGC